MINESINNTYFVGRTNTGFSLECFVLIGLWISVVWLTIVWYKRINYGLKLGQHNNGSIFVHLLNAYEITPNLLASNYLAFSSNILKPI